MFDTKGFHATDEQAKYLTDRGWTYKESPVGGSTIPMWTDADGHSMSLSLAWPLQQNRDAREERKQLRENRSDIFCNRCGENLKVMDRDECMGLHGLVHAEFTTGYYSTNLPDCNRYIFSICEKCMSELIGTFRIPPAIEFTL